MERSENVEESMDSTHSQGFLSSLANFSAKRGREKLCSGKRKDLTSMGGSFTPYVIVVNQGEEVLEKISSVSPKGSWRGCILSAHGRLYSITVCHAGSSATALYKGLFEIISLSGSFTITKRNRGGYRKGPTTISWAHCDNRVLGGEVAGPLMAATDIQVVVGLYTSEDRKKCQEQYVPKPFKPTLAHVSRQGSGSTSHRQVSFKEGSQVMQSSTVLKPDLNSDIDTDDDQSC